MTGLRTFRGSVSAPPRARVRIRPARPDDLQAVALVEAASYSTPWSPGTFRSLLERRGLHFFVAEIEREGSPRSPTVVAGHAVLWRVMDEAELANLAVAPEARGKGIGGALLDRVLMRARGDGVSSIFLEVRGSNARALGMYRRRGFRRVGVRRQYYDRPREDALILRLALA